MKKAVLVLLCAVFLSGCAPLAAAPVPVPSEATVTASPAFSPSAEASVPQATLPPSPWPYGAAALAAYRPFPGEYDYAKLYEMLAALPAIHIEMPRTGEKKTYFADDPYWSGYLTSGRLTRDKIDDLIAALNRAKSGQTLEAVLGGFGLSYQTGATEAIYEREDFLLHHVNEGEPCSAALTEMGNGVLRVTVVPYGQVDRTSICHLVFREENGLYRFAAMCTSAVYSGCDDDEIIANGGRLYFLCRCGAGWGSGFYGEYADLYPLQEGVCGYLHYAVTSEDYMWEVGENLGFGPPQLERMENGRLHFTLKGDFYYDDTSNMPFIGFEDIFSGTIVCHVYDDNDGKGLYVYGEDLHMGFSYLHGLSALEEPLERRLALMLRAQSDKVSLTAEDFLWQMDLSPEGYPFLSKPEIRARMKALEEIKYEAREESEKYYIGNAAPLPEASGSLTEAALTRLVRTLSDPKTDAAKAISSAGLTLPVNVAPPVPPTLHVGAFYDEAEYKRVVRYESGDALVIELREPDLTYNLHESLALLFLREGDRYALVAALTRWGSIYMEVDGSEAVIERIGGSYYLRYRADRLPEDGGEDFYGEVWAPFQKGGMETRLRFSGDLPLPGMDGQSLGYALRLPFAGELTDDTTVLEARVEYRLSAAGVEFSVPLRLYNDGDGEGFYSLDVNSEYFFGDIVSVPYAREQLEAQLKIRAESSKRFERACARMVLEKVFGE